MGPTTDSDLASPDAIAGRYTLQPLVPGEVVRRSHISARALAPGTLKGRQIVSLSTGAGNLPEVSVPEHVTLLFSPLPTAQAPAANLEVVEALLLNAHRTTDRVTLDVAVMDSDVPRLGRVAAQSLLVVATRGSEGSLATIQGISDAWPLTSRRAKLRRKWRASPAIAIAAWWRRRRTASSSARTIVLCS